MLRLLVLLSPILVAACATISPVPVAKQGFSIPYSDPDFSVEPEEVSQAAAPDYAVVLKRAARQDEAALERLFAISAASEWDAAGAEFHFSNMRRMLLVWGDSRFAHVLSRQSFDVRRAIGASLSFPEESEFRLHFPRTYAVAKKT